MPANFMGGGHGAGLQAVRLWTDRNSYAAGQPIFIALEPLPNPPPDWDQFVSPTDRIMMVVLLDEDGICWATSQSNELSAWQGSTSLAANSTSHRSIDAPNVKHPAPQGTNGLYSQGSSCGNTQHRVIFMPDLPVGKRLRLELRGRSALNSSWMWLERQVPGVPSSYGAAPDSALQLLNDPSSVYWVDSQTRNNLYDPYKFLKVAAGAVAPPAPTLLTATPRARSYEEYPTVDLTYNVATSADQLIGMRHWGYVVPDGGSGTFTEQFSEQLVDFDGGTQQMGHSGSYVTGPPVVGGDFYTDQKFSIKLRAENSAGASPPSNEILDLKFDFLPSFSFATIYPDTDRTGSTTLSAGQLYRNNLYGEYAYFLVADIVNSSVDWNLHLDTSASDYAVSIAQGGFARVGDPTGQEGIADFSELVLSAFGGPTLDVPMSVSGNSLSVVIVFKKGAVPDPYAGDKFKVSWEFTPA